MKLFFLGILILISTSGQASNWMPASKIQSGSSQAYQLESECIKRGEQCFDVGDEPEIVSRGFVSLSDEYSKSEVETCIDENDCQGKHEIKLCADSQESSIKNLDLMEVYCSKFLGKNFVKDITGWAAYKAEKAQDATMEMGISLAQKLQDCGKRVMAILLVRNQPKGLTSAQVKQLVSTYSPIKELLESGSLVSAKEEIQAVVSDGVLVTDGDKTAMTLEINKCLGI